MGSFIQRHFANLRHIRDVFRIDARAERGTGQIAPWLSGIVQLVHPAFPGAFVFTDPTGLSFADPPVGTDFTITVPPNQAWGLRALTYVLTTDGNAANRESLLVLDDTVNRFANVLPISVQIASTVARYSYGKGQGYQAELGLQKLHGLPDVTMDEGWRIRGTVNNIQVGDQISELTILVDVFPR